MVRTVPVRLGQRSYDVLVGEGLLSSASEHLKERGFKGKCAILTDSNVGPLYAEKLRAALEPNGFAPVIVTVPAGETSKCMSQAEEVCNAMIAAGLDRKSFLIALGGGVVGDLGGFVAAIYYRGIPFVQIPTSVLAQVDSSVGGKTGVNARGGKNLIGSFHQPSVVLADTSTLRSLPPREFNEGFAEVLKHGMIRDRSLLEQAATLPLPEMVARNVAIKAAVVEADEHETNGQRALLNFGHTVGHGIENGAGYGLFLHGEAISLGLVAALNLSVRKSGLSTEERDLALQTLKHFNLPTTLGDEVTTAQIMQALRKDKKFTEGQIRFVLLRRLGEAFLSGDVALKEIEAAIDELRVPAYAGASRR